LARSSKHVGGELSEGCVIPGDENQGLPGALFAVRAGCNEVVSGPHLIDNWPLVSVDGIRKGREVSLLSLLDVVVGLEYHCARWAGATNRRRPHPSTHNRTPNMRAAEVTGCWRGQQRHVGLQE
jgi:hypothetical protein